MHTHKFFDVATFSKATDVAHTHASDGQCSICLITPQSRVQSAQTTPIFARVRSALQKKAFDIIARSSMLFSESAMMTCQSNASCHLLRLRVLRERLTARLAISRKPLDNFPDNHNSCWEMHHCGGFMASVQTESSVVQSTGKNLASHSSNQQ